jgi:DNA-binding CsgD family transcriptional regulator
MGGLVKIVGLTLRCTTQSSLFDGTAFAKVFHLTSTERRVVEALFAGQTAEQIGGEFSISIGTVRAHIRHIYEKLGVASREALFHKALPFFSPS